MKEKTNIVIRILNILSAVLMLAVLIGQFIPYWSFGGEAVSIGSFVWFPEEHGDITAYFQDELNDRGFYSGSIAGINTIIMLVCAVGVVFCVKNSGDSWPAILSAACGMIGIVGFAAYPVFRMGAHWGLNIALSTGILALSGLSFAIWLKAKKQEKPAE